VEETYKQHAEKQPSAGLRAGLRSSPLRRNTPLRSGAPLARCTLLRQSSSRARARQRLWSAVTRQAIADNGGRCAFAIPDVCQGAAVDGHHLLPRSQGGTDTQENCAALCRACHEYVTQHPAWAYERGLLLKGLPVPSPARAACGEVAL
jgi:5-methylcytosine-specific restriction endonuclease McrA